MNSFESEKRSKIQIEKFENFSSNFKNLHCNNGFNESIRNTVLVFCSRYFTASDIDVIYCITQTKYALINIINQL